MPDDLFLENHRVTHALLQVYFHSIKIRLLLTQFGKAERLIVMLVEKQKLTPEGYQATQLMFHRGSQVISKFAMKSVYMCVLKPFGQILKLGIHMVLKFCTEQHFFSLTLTLQKLLFHGFSLVSCYFFIFEKELDFKVIFQNKSYFSYWHSLHDP